MVSLTESQQEAIDYMEKQYNVCITGPAGTGKTEIIRKFVLLCKSKEINLAITSTTGSSALLIGGTTLHSYLGIGYGSASVESLTSKILSYKWLRQRWNSLDCLIIDEISMLHPDLFDKLEEIARIVRANNRPFGGIQLILSGDFCQLPAVGCDKMCFESVSWNRCIKKVIHLKEIIRQQDPIFIEVLQKIRLGIIDRQVKDVIKSRVDVKLTNEHRIIPTRLYCKNINVDMINDQELEKLINQGKESYTYEMEFFFDKITIQSKESIKERFIKNCTAKQHLQIVEDSQVILLRNLDLQNGLANGSRGIVTGFVNGFPNVKFLSGIERIIDWYVWEVEENDRLVMSARQLPIKIAYAISIHSSQGMTLDYVSIDLSDVFEHGQAYTGLSRVKTLNGLCVERVHFLRLKAHPKAIEFYTKKSTDEGTDECDSSPPILFGGIRDRFLKT